MNANSMPSPEARRREAGEKALARLLAAGFVRTEPNVLQPAAAFLDLSGEEIRGRLYLTSDASGEELCLRPDYTIPVCRAHLASSRAREAADYAYLGPVFRARPGQSGEMTQTGLESYGRRDIEAADAEILALASMAGPGGTVAVNAPLTRPRGRCCAAARGPPGRCARANGERASPRAPAGSRRSRPTCRQWAEAQLCLPGSRRAMATSPPPPTPLPDSRPRPGAHAAPVQAGRVDPTRTSCRRQPAGRPRHGRLTRRGGSAGAPRDCLGGPRAMARRRRGGSLFSGC